MYKQTAAHIISLLLVAAALLCVLLLRTSAFHPSRLYNDEALLAQQSERHHSRLSRGVVLNQTPLDFSLGQFSGVRTVFILELAQGETLSCSWDIAVTKGSFKIVLIDSTNAVVAATLCEGTGSGSIANGSLPPGEYRVKLVGRSATAQGELHVAQG